MRVVLLNRAEGHLRDGFYWYEKQDPGAGEHFLRHMLSEIESLRQLAGIHRKVHGLHRLIPDRFPFGIYYRITGDTVEVAAVMDQRRRPAWIRRELGRR